VPGAFSAMYSASLARRERIDDTGSDFVVQTQIVVDGVDHDGECSPQGREQRTVQAPKSLEKANWRGVQIVPCVFAEFRKIFTEGGHPQGKRNDARGLLSEHG